MSVLSKSELVRVPEVVRAGVCVREIEVVGSRWIVGADGR